MEDKLTKDEEVRYSRHFNIPEFGRMGQLKLKNSSVLIAGCGGLGSASAIYLAAAGIGKIGLVDSDIVELSNLQRQIIHNMDSINQPKVISARNHINALNPNVNIEIFHERIEKENVKNIINEYEVIVDATDNFKTRYVLNAASVKKDIPFVYGAIFQFSGQMSVFNYAGNACFQCVFQQSPSKEFAQDNRGVGVVGALPGVIGALQAIEVIKLITGLGSIMAGRLLVFDGLDMRFREILINRNSQCPVCSH